MIGRWVVPSFSALRATLLGAVVVPAICIAQGTIQVIAGTGSILESGIGGAATSAGIGHPTGLAVDSAGNVYIADQLGKKVLKITKSTGAISVFAGSGVPLYSGDGGQATSAGMGFSSLHTGLAFDSSGNLYITDSTDNRIRKVNPSGLISTFAGSGTLGSAGFSGDQGPAINAQLSSPEGVAVDSAGNVYIADTGNGRIRKVDTTGTITTIAGSGNGFTLGDGGLALSAQFANPSDVAVDAKGNIYVADPGNERIRVIANGTINSVAMGLLTGICTATPKPASSPYEGIAYGLAVDSSGNVYFGDSIGGCVQEYQPATKTIVGVAGGGTAIAANGGPAISASLGNSVAVATDSSGNLYIGAVNGYIAEVSGLSTSTTPPVITAVENGANFQPGIAPNSWAQINGTNLSSVTDTWTIVNGVLPVTLDGVSVMVNGNPAYVYYVSPTQINIAVPPSAGTGVVPVIVKTAAGSSPAFSVLSSTYDPGLFLWPGGQPVATHSDFTWAVKNGTFAGTTTVPAKPGEVIILWGTGFGPTAPAVPPGIVVPAQSFPSTTLPMVSLNSETNTAASVYGAALAPGFAALWQVSFQVPPGLADGEYLLFGSIGGAVFQAQPFTVHH